ncbi:Rrf2 family transcriptional regulator [Psychrobacter maritimus]|jgi:Rrf2 family nitric oxide-sensitive transcriptional repressor|uniref:Rrf2 family transcriptional regulator n=1 Tax=Psychrobacter TaxID=497 RepID=UPI00191999B7|nr:MULTISPECIES: Rrf2 family transcriptional regulator [Psychrobacter]WGV14286.1 Rrf2 family transcriptional regulator [Psychrobacter sp. WB2]
MRLTNYSDYALRSLIYLATKPEPHLLANISDIANSYHISRSHLTKIIHQLGQLGYIDSVRGKNGGIRLACAPKDINLGVLIKQIEPDFNLVECFSTDLLINPKPDNANSDSSFNSNDDNAVAKDLSLTLIDEEASAGVKSGCIISPVCQLKQVFFEALTAFINVLERYTLADIISNEAELAELLFYRNGLNSFVK